MYTLTQTRAQQVHRRRRCRRFMLTHNTRKAGWHAHPHPSFGVVSLLSDDGDDVFTLALGFVRANLAPPTLQPFTMVMRKIIRSHYAYKYI